MLEDISFLSALVSNEDNLKRTVLNHSASLVCHHIIKNTIIYFNFKFKKILYIGCI